MIEQPGPLQFPRLGLGQVQNQPAGAIDNPGRNRDDLALDRRGGGSGQPGAGEDPTRAGEVERYDRAYQPGGIRGELP